MVNQTEREKRNFFDHIESGCASISAAGAGMVILAMLLGSVWFLIPIVIFLFIVGFLNSKLKE
ncbi:MAG: hypothetical protein N2249_05830 [Melioribacter sp.]|nr:hypothetical protein [Melioribacter sp.]